MSESVHGFRSYQVVTDTDVNGADLRAPTFQRKYDKKELNGIVRIEKTMLGHMCL